MGLTVRVVQVSTYGSIGGAARAARRLHAALRAARVDSVFLARHRAGSDPDVVLPATIGERLASRLAPAFDRLALRALAGEPEAFSLPLLPDAVPAETRRLGAALVHLHWVQHAFVGVGSVARFGVPVIWTLHDSWTLTGGCHVPGPCQRYRERCGACPALGSGRERDLSRWLWARKRRAWRAADLTFVAPTRWLAERARASSLLGGRRVEVIPNAVELDRFRPIDRTQARRRLGLPEDGRHVVLFGAYGGLGSANKGFDLLGAALGELARAGDLPLRLLLFGSPGTAQVPGVPVTNLGILSDDEAVALANACADVVAVPSRQEAFCFGVAEAQACARPVVAFRVSGIPELIEDGRTGVLAEPFEVPSLARALRGVLSDPERAARLSADGRAQAEASYAPASQARRHAALYAEILESRAR